MLVSLAACTLLGGTVYATGDGAAPYPVANDAAADGTGTLKGGSIAAGIGYPWGSR